MAIIHFTEDYFSVALKQDEQVIMEFLFFHG